VKLYFSRNYNPRLAVAVARQVEAPVEFEFASPFAPGQRARFAKLNPGLGLPILVEAGAEPLWEADAVACRLSQVTDAAFWRTGARLPDMMRWISWGYWNFVAACDRVHFERVTKARYGQGPINEVLIVSGLEQFHESAQQLDAIFARRDFLLSDGLSYADFRMASVLPYADLAGLPLAEYANLAAWYRRLEALPAWRDPFAGLEAPPLPAIAPWDERRGS